MKKLGFLFFGLSMLFCLGNEVLGMMSEVERLSKEEIWGEKIVLEVFDGDLENVRALLNDHENLVNYQAKIDGCTALIAAARVSWEIVSDLLKLGDIEINAKNLQGDTAAHCAAKVGNEVCVQLIISHPKFENKKNRLGKKFYDCFPKKEQQDRFKILYNEIVRFQ